MYSQRDKKHIATTTTNSIREQQMKCHLRIFLFFPFFMIPFPSHTFWRMLDTFVYTWFVRYICGSMDILMCLALWHQRQRLCGPNAGMTWCGKRRALGSSHPLSWETQWRDKYILLAVNWLCKMLCPLSCRLTNMRTCDSMHAFFQVLSFFSDENTPKEIRSNIFTAVQCALCTVQSKGKK